MSYATYRTELTHHWQARLNLTTSRTLRGEALYKALNDHDAVMPRQEDHGAILTGYTVWEYSHIDDDDDCWDERSMIAVFASKEDAWALVHSMVLQGNVTYDVEPLYVWPAQK